MQFRGTKDHYERETDEAERLVRPAPKVKPPRHDRRRETVQPDSDPDLKSDDKDLSMNYKNIGGSTNVRVLARWQDRQAEETPKIRVKHKDTGQVRDVTKEFLQSEAGGAYEPVDDKEETPKSEPQEQDAPSAESKPYEKGKTKPTQEDEAKQLESYRALQNAIDDDLDLQAFSKSVFDEKKPGGIGQLPNDFKLDKLKGLTDKFPALKQYKTLGEVRKALNNTKHLKRLEQHFQDKWKAPGAEPKEEAPQTAEKPDEKPEAHKSEQAPAGGPTLDPEKQKALTESGKQIREFAKEDPVFATVLHQLDAANPASLLKLREKIDPNEDVSALLQGAKHRLPENVKTVGDLMNALKSSEPTKEETPEKAPEQKEAPATAKPEEKKPEGTDATTEKLLKALEALGLKQKEPKHEGLDEASKSATHKFVQEKKHEDPAFKEWVDRDSSTVQDDDGTMLFPSDKLGEHVPFEKLSPEEQHSWVRRYEKGQRVDGNVKALKEQAAKDPHLARALQDLSNPDSDLARDVQELGDKGKLFNLKKSIPALRDLELPKGIRTVGDLIEAAEDMHPPLPPMPARRHVTPRDEDQAQQRIIEHFPVDVAEKFLDMDPPLHPDDVRDLVENYAAAKLEGNDEELFKAVEGNYETDPERVRPPLKGMNRHGDTMPFEDLGPGEQAEALQKHRMTVVAMSLAAREKQVQKLQKKTGAPAELLGAVADFSLSKQPNESDEEREERAKGAAKKLFGDAVKRGMMESDVDRYQRWQAQRNELVQQHQQEAEARGEEYNPDEDKDLPQRPPTQEISEKQLNKLFSQLGDDTSSKYLVAGYAQAGDYLRAREEFLDPDSPKAISEHESPEKIVKSINHMGEFFSDAAKKYPPEMRGLIPGKEDLRDKVLNRLRTLAPEKFPFVRGHVQEQIFDDYEDALKKWHKDYEKASKRHEKKIKKTPYRDGPGEAFDMPEPPARPDGYLQSRGSAKDRKNQRSQLLKNFRESVGTPDEELAQAEKTASLLQRVAAHNHKDSTCNPSWAMGVPLSVRVAERAKKSVYWGVEPYPKGHEGFAPYVPWTQVHQRDLGEKDFSSILKAAREWLKQPVLSSAVDGIYRDTQLRAALDLALRDHENGKYSVGLQPPLYNMLLARLGGAPQGETLLTDRSNIKGPITVALGSVYDSTGEGHSMKASAHIRQVAVRYAATNSAVAYDLLDLATKVAEQEQEQEQEQAPAQEQKQGGQVPPQFLEHMKEKKDEKKDDGQGQQKEAYTQLRAAVIKSAHTNPHLRDAYRPILELIKALG
jgi:hypothetical protein